VTLALHVRDLKKRYRDLEGGDRVVVDVPALDVAPGETVAVVGESGTGKTTLLHLIAGILVADEGTIEVAGEAMTGRSESQRDRLRARHVGYVFQTFNLLPSLTALENVEVGMSFRPGVSRPRALARAALDRVGLGDRLGHRPDQLSVGQQQRVAVARAIVSEPLIVLPDEPTANLDSAAGAALLDLMRRLNETKGITFVFSTHDPMVMQRARRIVRMRDGRVVASEVQA
jgi:putative ABC transport system ATP-binding protein